MKISFVLIPIWSSFKSSQSASPSISSIGSAPSLDASSAADLVKRPVVKKIPLSALPIMPPLKSLISLDPTLSLYLLHWKRTLNDIKDNFITPIPSIPSNQLPDIIESIDSYIIKRDSGDNNSSFAAKFINNGIPSSIVNADAKLKTEITSTEKTLANHLDSGSISNGNNYTKSTSLSEENLGSKI